jgi:hypothetical protein
VPVDHPRIDRFEAPGPQLDAGEQPRLFREIRPRARHRATDAGGGLFWPDAMPPRGAAE